MKLDKNFKMDRTTKSQMSLMDPNKKNIYKNMMIDAQLSSAIASKMESKNKKSEKTTEQ